MPAPIYLRRGDYKNTKRAVQELVAQIRNEKMRRRVNAQAESLIAAVQGGATGPDAMLSAISQATPQKTGLGGILDAFNPMTPATEGVTPLEQSILGKTIASEFMTPMEKARLESEKARQQYYKEGGSRVKITLPHSQSVADKDWDRDANILTSMTGSGKKKKYRYGVRSRELARNRLMQNPNLVTDPDEATFQTDDEYGKMLTPKWGVAGAFKGEQQKRGWFDRVFGEKAYTSTLEKIRDEALVAGVHPDLAEENFNRWWDEQYTKEAGQSFQKYRSRESWGPQKRQTGSSAAPAAAPAAAPKAAPAAAQKTGKNVKVMRAGEVPEDSPLGLEEIWQDPEVTDEEKITIMELLTGQPPVSVEDILNHYHKKKTSVEAILESYK